MYLCMHGHGEHTCPMCLPTGMQGHNEMWTVSHYNFHFKLKYE